MPRLSRTNVTRLLVCEGKAECELVRIVRDLYLPRYCGTALTFVNRRGFGGAAALELAIEMRCEGAHDAYGVLIDTDQHWGQDQRRLADEKGIVVVECSPCLEAVLLAVDGKRVHMRTADNKSEFERHYGAPAHREGVLRRHFDRCKLDSARARVSAIDALLSFLRC